MFKKLIIVIMFCLNLIFSQNLPYPVIFVHGLTGSDQTFEETMKYYSLQYNLGEINVYDVVLNADNDNTISILKNDVKWEDFDYEGTSINLGRRNFKDDIDSCSSEWNGSNIFAINFQEERIRGAVGFWDDLFDGSNQSAIVKQGFALGKMINEVLNYSGKEKVVLVGHSMGGLAIREYLQRTDNNNQHTNWVDKSDNISGHKVAKVVTIGTPHLGSNVLEFPFAKSTGGCMSKIPDLWGEAVRDLRYNYNDYGLQGRYLFGGDESSGYNNTFFHNFDVNCDGDIDDVIIGINEGFSGTTYNSDMPLPQNIQYTWITSNISVDEYKTDGIVELDRQWIYKNGESQPKNVSDTLLTNKQHTSEGSDYYSILRGLDEPDNKEVAYSLYCDEKNLGFITKKMYSNPIDNDFYKIQINEPSILNFYLLNRNTGVNKVYILNEEQEVMNSMNSIPGMIETYLHRGDYYIKVEGIATNSSWQNPYELYYLLKPAGSPENLSATIINENNVQLNWESPLESDWKSYVTYSQSDVFTWAGTERATIFNSSDLNYTYPVKLQAVSCYFYEHPDYPWESDEYKIKIYSEDGNDILYSSSVLYAESDVELIHYLDKTIELNEDFSISIEPLVEGGFPSSLGVKVDKGTTHSYYKDSGNWYWHQSEDYDMEYLISAYIKFQGNSLTKITNTKKSNKVSLREDFCANNIAKYTKSIDKKSNTSTELTGYIIYRDGELLQTVNHNTFLYIDNNVANGEHNYYITAKYGNLESSSSNEVTVNVEVEYNLIINENFDNIGNSLSNWKISSLNNDNTWRISNPQDNPFSTIDVTSKYSAVCPWVAEDQNECLISPYFSLADGNAYVDFYVGHSTSFLPNATLKLFISENDGESWIKLWEAENDNEGWKWRNINIDLSSYKNKKSLKLMWQYVGNDGDLVAIDNVFVYGSKGSVDIKNTGKVIDDYYLYNNYPNPFNPTTKISYSLKQPCAVKINIYNSSGQFVSQLINEAQSSGYHSVILDAGSYPSGIYFYQLITENFTQTKKMILIK